MLYKHTWCSKTLIHIVAIYHTQNVWWMLSILMLMQIPQWIGKLLLAIIATWLSTHGNDYIILKHFMATHDMVDIVFHGTSWLYYCPLLFNVHYTWNSCIDKCTAVFYALILTKLCPRIFLRDDRPVWTLSVNDPPVQLQVYHWKHELVWISIQLITQAVLGKIPEEHRTICCTRC